MRGGGVEDRGHAGAAPRLRAAPVRPRPRSALPHDDRHRGEPERRGGLVIGIEPGWTQRIVDGIGETGKPVAGFSIEGQGDLETVRQACRAAVGSSRTRRSCDASGELTELVICIKCGESDTTTGLGSCPTVGEAVDRLVDAGATVIFGETSELTGGEHLVADRMHGRAARGFWRRTTTTSRRSPRRRRPARLAADPGQHRRRTDDDRGEGAGQHPEARQADDRRRPGARRGADRRPGTVLHGHPSAAAGVRHALGRRRCGRPPVPDRAGQRDRQPDRAGDQGQRRTPDRRDDDRAHRPRRRGAPHAAR